VSNEPPKHSRLSHVPAILAGSAALVAAVSTLYVNLRGSSPAQAEAAATISAPAMPPAGAPASASTPPVEHAPKAKLMLVKLDRLQVENDGSVGSTDWTFEVDVDGEPRFTLAMPSLTDKPGKNLVRPTDPGQASTEVLFLPAKQVEISVKAWKRGFLPGTDAEISGATKVNWNFDKTAVHLVGDKPKSPAFTLYFTLAPSR
jgi:hypothetical protein